MTGALPVLVLDLAVVVEADGGEAHAVRHTRLVGFATRVALTQQA